jgi:hypothetical protein
MPLYMYQFGGYARGNDQFVACNASTLIETFMNTYIHTYIHTYMYIYIHTVMNFILWLTNLYSENHIERIFGLFPFRIYNNNIYQSS